MSNRASTTDAVEIMNRLYVKEDPEKIRRLEELDIEFEIAQHIYDLRTAGAQTQEEFGEMVGLDPRIVEALEAADYEGDSFAMLAHIEKVLWPDSPTFDFRVEGVYPNALLGATVTGFRRTLFRYHPGRKITTCPTASFTAIRFNVETLHSRQYTLNELMPWLQAFAFNRKELSMFARAGLDKWLHIKDVLRLNCSGNPNEYIRAVDTHTQLIKAVMQYLETGEHIGFKQWRQDSGPQGAARYTAELEKALDEKAFEELPDTEWLTQTLLGFVKMSSENSDITRKLS